MTFKINRALTSEAQEEKPSLDLFFETVHSFYKTEAIKAAISLELFTAIAEGADTVEVIAQRCKASERGIGILCNFLVLMGFLKKDNANRYSLAIDSKVFLDKHSPYYVGESIKFLQSPPQVEGFREFLSIIRGGRINPSSRGVTSPENPVWVTFAQYMMPILKLPAELLASKLIVEELKKPIRVLDVAAGHGLFGISIAKLNKNAQIVAADWPNVLKVAQENAYSEGVAERVSLLPGDILEIPLKENDYDLVLIPNFLHHFGMKTIERFLSKIYTSLKHGGTIAILEFIPNEDRVSPAIAVMFSVMMLVTTPEGNAYTFSDYYRALHSARFSEIKLLELPPTYFRAILAKK